MNQIFDSRVEYAVKNIWQTPADGNGAEAMRKLMEAAEEGDGDACYFLARCYFGSCFVDPVLGFEDNDELGEQYLQKSLELGSAVGMLGALRVGGFEPKDDRYVYPPYNSLVEVWKEVEKKAKAGQGFCQFMLGAACYYGDAPYIFGVEERLWEKAMVQYRKEAIAWLDKSIANGYERGIGMMVSIYSEGEYGIPENEQQRNRYIQIGADKKLGRFEYMLADLYEENGEIGKAKELYERAIEHCEYDAYFKLGRFYTFDGALQRNLVKAKEYFELALDKGEEKAGCWNRLGEIYFYGGDGIQVDYDKAFSYLRNARSKNDWCSDMLGTCYLKGLGTPVDYTAARNEFEIYESECLSSIGLGEIYAYGLGVEQNIKLGIQYFKQFPDHPRVIENMRHFKKTLFGWKQID